MPIIQNQLNTDNSPWYDIMEQRSQIWEEFANKNELEVTGYYNAFIVEFLMKNNKTEISGLRQVPRISTIWVLSSLEQMTETFTFDYKSSFNNRRNSIFINRGSFWNFFRKKYRSKRRYGKYRIFYNSENELLKLTNTKILEYKELRKLKVGNNKVKLVLYELPDNTQIIKSLLEFCKSLK